MSGRYQSKVFNFFSQQSFRLRDQSAQTWRQLKIAAVWGVQILLYPIYVGFQTSRLTGKQLRQTVRQTLPRLRAAQQTLQQGKAENALSSAADRPVRQTLKAIASLEVLADDHNLLLLPAEADSDIERELALYVHQHPEKAVPVVAGSVPVAADVAAVRIQGVASLLTTRSLVLVTTRNQLLDILSPEQQAQLTRRMILESANHWRRQRLLRQPSQSTPILVSNYLPLPKQQKHALLPIQLFQQAMAWMQRGSVAVSVNLFQESRLVAVAPAARLELPAASTLRSAQPSWVAIEAQFYTGLGKVGQVTSALLVAGLEMSITTFSKFSAQRTAGSSNSTVALPQLQPARSDSSSFSWPQRAAAKLATDWLVALDRWISKLPGSKELAMLPQSNPHGLAGTDGLEQSHCPSATPDLTAVPQSVDKSAMIGAGSQINSWLRQRLRAILPAQSRLSAPQQTENWELVDTSVGGAVRANLDRPKSNRIGFLAWQRQFRREMQTPLPTDHWDADFHIVRASARSLEPKDVPLSSLDTANIEEAAMIPQSWIETEAQLVGYVKHPLEQLLEWIDTGMVWVENQIARVWRWLTRSLT